MAPDPASSPSPEFGLSWRVQPDVAKGNNLSYCCDVSVRCQKEYLDILHKSDPLSILNFDWTTSRLLGINEEFVSSFERGSLT